MDDLHELQNDLAILGLPATRIADIHTCEGTYHVVIDIVGVDLSLAEKERLAEDFNEEIKVLEFSFGVTYSFIKKSNQPTRSLYISSSSLEEIWEMYKADRTNQSIPERKCKLSNYFKKPSDIEN